MNKLTKRVLAGVASAAIALTGLFAGASAASAAPAAPGTVVSGTDKTLTFKATNEGQLKNHTLKYLKIADYIDYGSTGTGTSSTEQYGLQTSDALKDQIRNFLHDLGKTVPADEDPLAWAQSQDPAIFGKYQRWLW